MTQILDHSDVADAFELKLQLSPLWYVTSSPTAAASLVYVGLEVV